MKRSEMIDIMHNHISSVLQTTEEFNKKDCSDLLDKMEKSGVLPPRVELNSLGVSDNAWETE